MSKRALLVGINNFVQPDWRLRGCHNDSLAMRAALTGLLGFEEGEVKILADVDATASGIRAGLAWLLSEYEGDDVRLFHFAGHGTQVDDQSGDEWECKDEVIVTYDHSWDDPFRDDELREIFETIPDPVHFVFVADCCHSGTIQRKLLDAEVEFTPRYLTPPAEVTGRIEGLRAERDVKSDAWAAAQLTEMLQKLPPDQWQAKMQTYLGQLRERFKENRYAVVPQERHILLAACEDRQTAADARIGGEYHGAFTWSLCTALQDSGGNLTYREWIERAAAAVQPYGQRPQLEGPGALLDRKALTTA